MKLNTNDILNVLVALAVFEVLNRLFLADLIDQIAPAAPAKTFERTV